MSIRRIELFATVLVAMVTLHAWALTDLTTPTGGTITHSSVYGTAAGTFDDNITTAGRWLAYKVDFPVYAQYQFTGDVSHVVSSYRVWGSPYGSTRSPQDFTLSGSANGADWAVLDARSGETGWALAEPRLYAFANATSYSYFRLTITANNGDGTYMSLADLELFPPVAATPASNPAPANAAADLHRDVTLSWSGDGLSYDVYFSPDAVLTPADFQTNVPLTFHAQGELAYSTPYYWRVDAVYDGGMVVTGATWSFTTADPAEALTIHDGFEAYAVAGMNGQGAAGDGWLSAWTAVSVAQVVATSLHYEAGEILVDGGGRAVQIDESETSSAMRRDFATQDIGQVYFSLLLQGSTPAGDSLSIGLRDTTRTDILNSAGVNFAFPANAIGAELYDGSAAKARVGTGVVPNDAETYFVVARVQRTGIDADYECVHVLVNPTTRAEPESGWTSATLPNVDIDSLGRINFRTYYMEAGDTFLVDELRIGTTFESVLPPPPVPGGAVFVVR